VALSTRRVVEADDQHVGPCWHISERNVEPLDEHIAGIERVRIDA
jgi:hypothetical protein